MNGLPSLSTKNASVRGNTLPLALSHLIALTGEVEQRDRDIDRHGAEVVGMIFQDGWEIDDLHCYRPG